MFTNYPPLPQISRKEIFKLAYKLDLLLSRIGTIVNQLIGEQKFVKQEFLEYIKSQIDNALKVGVNINCLGRVSCLNSMLEGCSTLPNIYKNSITAELTAYIINKGADVVSSGCVYVYMPPLKFAEQYGYNESVTNLIKTTIQKQTSGQSTI